MTSDAEALIRQYWDSIFVERDLAAVDALVTEPSIRHTASGTKLFSRAEIKTHLGDVLAAFRTKEIVFEAVTVDGDDVWLRATIHAVSLATMESFSIAWLSQYRLQHGRIAEAWSLHQSHMDWTH